MAVNVVRDPGAGGGVAIRVGVGDAAGSGIQPGLVWESVGEASAAVHHVDRRGGGAGIRDTGGLLDWSLSGKWSMGGDELAGDESPTGGHLVESEGLAQAVVQVVEGHVVEDGSQEVGVDHAVLLCALGFVGVSKAGVVRAGAKSLVIVDWVEWVVQLGEDVVVLHADVTEPVVVLGVDHNTVLAVVPRLAESVDAVHHWASRRVRVSEVAPAAVVEDVGEGEEVHHVSLIVAASSHHRDNVGAVLDGGAPHARDVVGHGNRT